MNLRTFKQHKLWRDKAVDQSNQGSRIHWIQLSDSEFCKQLKLKLVDEANDALHATTKETIIEELADILEVIDALAQACKISQKELIAYKKTKRDKKGGFEGRKFVTFAEHPSDSFGERYCLANPEKFPEIKN